MTTASLAALPDTDTAHPAHARIVPHTPLAGFAAIPEHIYRPPRLAVRLAAPEEAEPLLAALVDDLAALRVQVEADHAAHKETIEREYRAGDMAPNRRSAALAAAEQERAARLERIDAQMADLHPDALLERARHAAEEAIAAHWHETLAVWTRPQSTPRHGKERTRR